MGYIGKMITVLQARGLSFAIYIDDHPPPHVHVYGDGVAKIVIVGGSGRPELIYARGLKDSDVKKAMKIVSESRADLLARWSQIHG